MSSGTGRVAVMVVRIWIEDDGGFRARLTHTRDLSEREEASDVAGTPDQVVAAVREWIDAFVLETP
jgi:alkanesulfonate monooxygenase SsuD/methylene tetrahydromethanopterin reductase-like flavin-dependent oxidoreductase (luciferase family)